MLSALNDLVSLPYDCLILVHPQIQVLDQAQRHLQSIVAEYIRVGRELSSHLLAYPVQERGQQTENWFLERIRLFSRGPILCADPYLFFEPSLKINPFMLFKRASALARIIVPWLGCYSEGLLLYATPEHHHYQFWKFPPLENRYPVIKIHQLTTE